MGSRFNYLDHTAACC
uniref:Uncharacterized protein n=1 Tax=Arundo donax TaxID=35708 RepID=A0A0A9F251_ARUDO